MAALAGQQLVPAAVPGQRLEDGWLGVESEARRGGGQSWVQSQPTLTLTLTLTLT